MCGSVPHERLDLDTVLSWVPEGAGCLISAVAMGPFSAAERGEGAIGGRGYRSSQLGHRSQQRLDVIQEDINDGLHCFTTNRFDVVILAHALQELTHPYRASTYGRYRMKRSCRSLTLAIGRAGCIWVSKVACPCPGPCRATGTTPQHSLLHRYGLRRTVLSTSHRHYRESHHSRSCTAFLGRWLPNLFATSAIYRIRRSGG